MERDLLEAANRLDMATTLDKAWQLVTEALSACHIERAIYLVAQDKPGQRWFVRSNLPDNWPEGQDSNPAFKEPFLTYCCATFDFTKIGSEYMADHESYIDDYTRNYIQSMLRFDWRAGLGIPCCLRGSGQHGGFLIGNAMTRHDFERGVLPRAEQLRSFCMIAHRKLDALRQDRQTVGEQRALSAREHQTLEQLAHGLRPKTIAANLGLSEASVRLYLKNARLKLGASTKEEALTLFLKSQAALTPPQD